MVLRNNRFGEESIWPMDLVVINIGFRPSPEALTSWGAECDLDGIKVDNAMRTSRPGVFACGDIACYPGKTKLIVTACSDGATAAHSAYEYLRSKILY